jgi:Leucine-rich repeat (LRR) protein
MFSALRLLRKLFFQNNQLQRLEKETFEGLDNLEQLEFHKNQLKFLHPDLFANKRNLKTLVFHSNEIGFLVEEIFKDLGSLTKLDMSFNKVQYIPAKIFEHMADLQFLNISGNLVGSIDDLSFNKANKIQEIQIADMGLFNIPRFLKELPAIKIIDIAKNDLRSFDPQLLEKPTLEKVLIDERTMKFLERGFMALSVSNLPTRYSDMLRNKIQVVKNNVDFLFTFS